MPPFPPDQLPSPLAAWMGRGLSFLTTAFLLSDAVVHLAAPELVRAQMEGSGFAFGQAAPVGAISLTCAALYAVPRTAVIGAIIATGFFGGAIGAHFRLGEIGAPSQIVALLAGVSAWGGLYLRKPRLRALLPVVSPIRRGQSGSPVAAE